MGLRYLLDTNILSEPLRARPDEGVLRRLREHQNEAATAPVVWHETLPGAYRLPPGRRRSAIREYPDGVLWPSLPILPYDAPAAGWHAEERARLVAAGTTPSFVDGQVAAVARMNDLVIVTSSVADYAGFESVRVEDWRAG